MSASASDHGSEKDHFISAGVTLFLLMSYIIVINPSVLSCAQSASKDCVAVPAGGVFLGTCLTAGIFSIIAGKVTGQPTALASGMVFNLYFMQFVTQNKMSWQAGFLLCSIAGMLVFLMSISGLRYKMVRSIPPALARSIGGGIGALLAETAIKYLHVGDTEQFNGYSVFLFVVGLAIIFPVYFNLRQYGSSRLTGNTRRLCEIVGSSAFIISAAIVWALSRFKSDEFVHIKYKIEFLWANSTNWQGILNIPPYPAVSFVIFLVYMLVIDIIGSPYQMVGHIESAGAMTPNEERIAQKGFYIDSIANIFAPVFGTSPVVFYAENHSARMLDARGGAVAMLAGSLFLGVAAIALVISWFNVSLPMPPKVAIAPTLFFVGLLVVAETLQLHGSAVARLPEIGSLFNDPEKLLDSVPAAVTIILTPLIDIQFGLAGGIVAFLVISSLLPEQRRKEELDARPAFIGLACLAVVAVVVVSIVSLAGASH